MEKRTVSWAIHTIFMRILLLPTTVIIVVSVIIILSVIGPIGTYERFSLFSRFVIFSVWIIYSIAAYYGSIMISNIMFGRRDELYFFPAFVLTIFSISIGGSAISTLILGNSFDLQYFLYTVGPSIIISTPIVFGFYFYYASVLEKFFNLHELTLHLVISNEKKVDSILSRIPYVNRGEPIRLEAQNQYTNLTTISGESLIRISVSDAINEIEVTKGMRIHRSHWVAFDHILEVNRGKHRQLSITLSDGSEIPVSRNLQKQFISGFNIHSSLNKKSDKSTSSSVTSIS